MHHYTCGMGEGSRPVEAADPSDHRTAHPASGEGISAQRHKLPAVRRHAVAEGSGREGEAVFLNNRAVGGARRQRSGCRGLSDTANEHVRMSVWPICVGLTIRTDVRVFRHWTGDAVSV